MTFRFFGKYLNPSMCDPGWTYFPAARSVTTPLMVKIGGRHLPAVHVSVILTERCHLKSPPDGGWKYKFIEGSMIGPLHDRACSFFHMAYGSLGLRAQIINTNIAYQSQWVPCESLFFVACSLRRINGYSE